MSGVIALISAHVMLRDVVRTDLAKTLDLSSDPWSATKNRNHIGDVGAEKLAEALPHLTNLTVAWLCSQSFVCGIRSAPRRAMRAWLLLLASCEHVFENQCSFGLEFILHGLITMKTQGSVFKTQCSIVQTHCSVLRSQRFVFRIEGFVLKTQASVLRTQGFVS